MSEFKPRLGTKYQTQLSPVVDGQFIVSTDSRELFYDDGSLRIPLADIVFLNTEADREEILAPLPKFYFVIASSILYVWDGNVWSGINSDPFNKYWPPPTGSPPTLLFARDKRIMSLRPGNEGDILTVRNNEIVWEKLEYQ